ncbi:MAG: ABC transporter ATP-binding protein [Blastopirellula sp.]|nr:ABC transporter ATP-binding protein [Blastopirellula sp.]
MTPLISLRQIAKKYQRHWALRDVNLDIHPGVTGLLGPNGAGKSTLIKVLLGLVKVTTGSGSVLGEAIGRGGREVRNRIGYVPEDDCYIPGMTGIEVVEFAATLSGLPGIEALRRAHEILDFCNVRQERYRAIESYSTGMRQKIKFAAAIVHDPELLILDEPTSGLDPEERESLLNRIRFLAREHGKSILLSTHILPDVQSVCDQVVILARGEIRLNTSFEEMNRPRVPSVTLTLLAENPEFARRLADSGLNVERNPGGEWLVTGSDHAVADTVWHLAQSTGATLQSLKPARNSLEEIFLEAVKESPDANS